jgi:hypothetical protein
MLFLAIPRVPFAAERPAVNPGSFPPTMEDVAAFLDSHAVGPVQTKKEPRALSLRPAADGRDSRSGESPLDVSENR